MSSEAPTSPTSPALSHPSHLVELPTHVAASEPSISFIAKVPSQVTLLLAEQGQEANIVRTTLFLSF
jgi:hypothetical protein